MHTLESLTADLRDLPLPTDTVILVHSGYRAVGPVEGGPATVVAALRAAGGPTTTFAAPTFTSQLTDPYTWPVPPPPEERARIVEAMPRFDPAVSPPHHMGAIATALWRTPGALRSTHPVTSWSAIGPLAEALTRDPPLDDPEGANGTIGRVWRADGWVLLLGVDHDADTTIHLAESLLEMPHLLELPDRWPDEDERGTRIWREIRKTTKCSDGFVQIRPHIERAGIVRRGRVGSALAELLRSRDLVRVAGELLSEEPTALLCDDPTCVHCPTSRRVLTKFRPVAGDIDATRGHIRG